MHEPYVYVAPDNPAIVKNNDLCTSCGHCYAVCEEANGVAGREKVACLNCGQCAVACPEQAITPKNDVPLVEAAVNDPEKIVVFSTSPSVRVGLGDAFGRLDGQYVEDKMVAALRALGGDYVLDVTFSADLTIVEEGTELLSRILDQSGPLPQFTSCCPAWVKYAETFHPEILPNISSAKSPIGMQGALVKTYFAFQNQIDPQNIVHVAVTPCTAKKFEISRPELNVAGAAGCCPQMRDVDYVVDGDGTWRYLDAVQSNFDTFRGTTLIEGGSAEQPGISTGEFERLMSGSAMVTNILDQQRDFRQYVVMPFPYYTLTKEQSDAIAPLQKELGYYVDMQIARWVLGEEEISDESFAAFEEKLNELGLNEFLSFWQDVLNRM